MWRILCVLLATVAAIALTASASASPSALVMTPQTLNFGAITVDTPATLTGEHFANSTVPESVTCTTGGNFSFTASGVATGPYPGTYTETGTGTVFAPTVGLIGTVTDFSATFTIYSPSGDVLVTGTKSVDTSVPNTSIACLQPPRVGAGVIPTTYEATIYTATGNYRDQGSSLVLEVFSGPPATALIEDFVSSLIEPIPVAPSSKEQCEGGGWQNYPQFKNQGDCVSFVTTNGKNEPGKNNP
jgi:hypothetical protein